MLGGAAWLYIPKGYEPGRGHASVLMLHDDFQDGEDFLEDTKFAAIADRDNLVLIAPNDEINIYGQAWVDEDDLESAIGAYKSLQRELCLDPDRLYGLGHALGGRALEYLSCEFEFAAIATTATRRRPDLALCEPQPPVPYLMISGKQDGYAPIEGGENCNEVDHPLSRSLADKEEVYRTFNGCGEARASTTLRGGTCTEWKNCEERFVSCVADGGREWPNVGYKSWASNEKRQKCVGSNNKFPFRETVGKFFRTAGAN